MLLNTLYLNYYTVGKKSLITQVLIGTILMDLSKAHDCLPHDLKGMLSRFENFTICSSQYKNNTLKIPHS